MRDGVEKSNATGKSKPISKCCGGKDTSEQLLPQLLHPWDPSAGKKEPRLSKGERELFLIARITPIPFPFHHLVGEIDNRPGRDETREPLARR